MSNIKTVKIIIVSVLLIICMAIPSQLFQLYAINFGSGIHSITIKKQEGETTAQNAEKLLRAAEKNGVDIFVSQVKADSVFHTSVTVYSSRKTTEKIERDYYLKPGKCVSLFSGATEVAYADFSEYDFADVSVPFRLVGSESGIASFRSDIADSFECSLPKIRDRAVLPQFRQWFTAAFVTDILLCVIFSVYECFYKRKEYFIKMANGENTARFVLKNCLIDQLIFAAVFLLSLFADYLLVNRFLLKEAVILYAVLSSADAVSYCAVISRKSVTLKGFAKPGRKALTLNYIVKGATVFITCSVISASFVYVADMLEYLAQKPFFEKYSDYCYYANFSGDVDEKLYKQHFADLDIFCLCYETSVNGKDIYFANKNTKDYLCEKIEGFENLDFSRENYLLVPERVKLTDRDMEEIMNYAYSSDCEIFRYKKAEKTVMRMLESQPITRYVKNPIIIFDNTDSPIFNELTVSMEKQNDEIMSSFAAKYKTTYSTTNMLDFYNYRLVFLRRKALLSGIFALLLLITELIVTASVLKMEYAVNALPLALKKIYGYTDVERFSGLYKITVFVWLSGIITAVAVSLAAKMGSPLYVLAGGTAVLIFDLALNAVNIIKTDRINTQKILKGGAL